MIEDGEFEKAIAKRQKHKKCKGGKTKTWKSGSLKVRHEKQKLNKGSKFRNYNSWVQVA